MASQQYDVDPNFRQVVEEKAKRRAVLREEFLKQRFNPFQHATGEGGTVFDPAIMRYQAMRVSGWDYFKPSGKNAIYGMAFMVLPMFIYGYFVKTDRAEQEAKYRRGEVAYKDRRFKFV
nr:unnamed protein product [Callosobruchus chinensis]